MLVGGSDDRQPTPAMHARTTRQQRIVDHVLVAGSASAAELADLAGVSLMTVHRDVDELVRRGLVRKYHGGVSAQPKSSWRRTASTGGLSASYRSRTRLPLGTAIDSGAASSTICQPRRLMSL